MKVYGKNVLYEALRSNHKIYEVYLREDVAKSDVSFLNKLNQRKIKVHILDKHQMNQMFDGLHQGYGANIENFKNYALEDVINPEKRQLFLILDKLNDPNNLGAIIRTANLAGAHGVIIPKRHAVGLTATVARTSAGALNYTPVAKVTNISATIEELKKEGLWFVCADMGGESMYKLNLNGPIGLVIGNEGEGVSRLVREKCDFIASIPMKGDIDSLNASVAAGVLAYEIVRQRLGAK